MAEFRFLFDESFLIEAFRKYRKQHGTRYASIVIKCVASLLLLGLAAFGVAERLWWLVAFFVALILLMFNGHLIDFWLFKRRFRKSPYKDESMVITLSDDGFHAVGSKSDSKLTWAAFTKARRFTDGFLLFQGPGLFNWLPEAAMTDGTAVEVDSLIETNVNDYQIVEQVSGADSAARSSTE